MMDGKLARRGRREKASNRSREYAYRVGGAVRDAPTAAVVELLPREAPNPPPTILPVQPPCLRSRRERQQQRGGYAGGSLG